MQDISRAKKSLSGGEIFGLIIFIVSIIIACNDFIFIPIKRKAYLADCVILQSMTININVADSITRQVFYDCNGKAPTPQQVQACWKAIIPQTANYSNTVINECISAIDYPSKILFD